MTLYVIAIWLALQIPVGTLLGRLLQDRAAQAAAVPVRSRRIPGHRRF